MREWGGGVLFIFCSMYTQGMGGSKNNLHIYYNNHYKKKKSSLLSFMYSNVYTIFWLDSNAS